MQDKKILIVDYDAKSLHKMAEMFTPCKLEIVTATDGQMAYEKYKKEKPNLILLEAMLPKLHGFDLTQKIYNETKGSIPVVIVTGLYKGAQYKNEALQSFGAADYFEKPFDKDKLVKSVLNLLHDEVDISEDLPDPDVVIKMISDDEEGQSSSS
jgi:DNA-binding response OmpR family regulator